MFTKSKSGALKRILESCSAQPKLILDFDTMNIAKVTIFLSQRVYIKGVKNSLGARGLSRALNSPILLASYVSYIFAPHAKACLERTLVLSLNKLLQCAKSSAGRFPKVSFKFRYVF